MDMRRELSLTSRACGLQNVRVGVECFIIALANATSKSQLSKQTL